MTYPHGPKPPKKEYQNSGVLFPNDDKESPKHKDFGGSGSLNCPFCQAKIELWLSAWVKQGRSSDFLSLSLQPKIQSGRQANQPQRSVSLPSEFLSAQKNAPRSGGASRSSTQQQGDDTSGYDPSDFDNLPSRRPEPFDDDIPF